MEFPQQIRERTVPIKEDDWIPFADEPEGGRDFNPTDPPFNIFFVKNK